MSTIVGLDPGPEQSAYCVLVDGAPWLIDKLPNEDVRNHLQCETSDDDEVVIEWIQCYGMRVGAETFETCFWAGRFTEAILPRVMNRLTRSKIRACVCRDMLANDANVRAALIERFGPTKAEAIGTKKKPGPLYRIRKDMWSALAVAVTYYDTEIAGKVK